MRFRLQLWIAFFEGKVKRQIASAKKMAAMYAAPATNWL
jgi:hypothetical protein